MQSDAVLGTLGTYQPQPRTRAGAQTCALLQRMEEEPASYLETYQLGFLFSWHLAKGWSMGKRKEPEFTRRTGCWVRTQHTRIVRLLLSEQSINYQPNIRQINDLFHSGQDHSTYATLAI